VPLHELDVVRELPPQVLRKVLDLRRPLEPLVSITPTERKTKFRNVPGNTG